MAKKTIVDIFYLGYRVRVEDTANGIAMYPSNRKSKCKYQTPVTAGIVCHYDRGGDKTLGLINKLGEMKNLRADLRSKVVGFLKKEIFEHFAWRSRGTGTRALVPKASASEKLAFTYSLLVANTTSMNAMLYWDKNLWIKLEDGGVNFVEHKDSFREHVDIPRSTRNKARYLTGDLHASVLKAYKQALVEYFNPQIKYDDLTVIKSEFFKFILNDNGTTKPVDIDVENMQRRRTPCQRFAVYSQNNIVDALGKVHELSNAGLDLEALTMRTFAENFLKEEFVDTITDVNVKDLVLKFQNYSTSWSVTYFKGKERVVLNANLKPARDDASAYTQEPGTCIINFGGVPYNAQGAARDFVENALFRTYVHDENTYQRKHLTAQGGTMSNATPRNFKHQDIANVAQSLSALLTGRKEMNKENIASQPHASQTFARQQQAMQHAAWQPPYSTQASMQDRKPHGFVNTPVGIIKFTREEDNRVVFSLADRSMCTLGFGFVAQGVFGRYGETEEQNFEDTIRLFNDEDFFNSIMVGAIRKYLKMSPNDRCETHIDNEAARVIHSFEQGTPAYVHYNAFGVKYILQASKGYTVVREAVTGGEVPGGSVANDVILEAMFQEHVIDDVIKQRGHDIMVSYCCKGFRIKKEDGVWTAERVTAQDKATFSDNLSLIESAGNKWERLVEKATYAHNQDVIRQLCSDLEMVTANNGDQPSDVYPKTYHVENFGAYECKDKCIEIIRKVAEKEDAGMSEIEKGMFLNKLLVEAGVDMGTFLQVLFSKEGMLASAGTNPIKSAKKMDLDPEGGRDARRMHTEAVEEKEYINYYAQLVAEHTYNGETCISIACAVPAELQEAVYTSIYGLKPNGESVAICDVHDEDKVNAILEGLLNTL